MTDITRQVQAAYDQLVDAYAGRNHGAMPNNVLRLARRLDAAVAHQGRLLGDAATVALEDHSGTVTRQHEHQRWQQENFNLRS